MEKINSLMDCEWLDLNTLKNSSILITGATGLLGYNIIKELSAISSEFNIKILALVRSKQRAEIILSEFLDKIELVVGDVLNPIETPHNLDYIIHGASVTSSKTFVEKPVETIMTSVMGTKNILDLALKKDVKSIVYLSSMEVYGSPTQFKKLTEADIDYVDPLNVRSSYPQSKRLCETLCVSYAKEYNVNVKIARLVQTFGPGMAPEDKRAIVQFIKSAKKGENIEIKASGESARMYLYTFDAVSSILTLLLNGNSGEAYNLANKESYCSVKELAEHIVEVAGTASKVKVNTGTDEERAIYPPDSFLYLDTTKIEALGWQAKYNLNDSIFKTYKFLEGK